MINEILVWCCGFSVSGWWCSSFASCGVCVSRLIRFARVSSHVDDFNTRNKVLAAGLLRQGYGYHKIRRAFSKFYRQHFDMMSKYCVGLRALVLQGLSEPGFCGGLVSGSGEVVGDYGFPCRFRGMIVYYRKIGCGMDVLRQTACLVVNPIKVGSSVCLFGCAAVGRPSD